MAAPAGPPQGFHRAGHRRTVSEGCPSYGLPHGGGGVLDRCSVSDGYGGPPLPHALPPPLGPPRSGLVVGASTPYNFNIDHLIQSIQAVGRSPPPPLAVDEPDPGSCLTPRAFGNVGFSWGSPEAPRRRDSCDSLAEEALPASVPATLLVGGGMQRDDAEVTLHVYYTRKVPTNTKKEKGFDGPNGNSGLNYLWKDLLGVYHVGICARGVEFAFGTYSGANSRRMGSPPAGMASGVCAHEPRQAGAGYELKQPVLLGVTMLSTAEIEAIAAEFGSGAFASHTYDKINHNCVDFAQEFSQRLGADDLPLWCYRGAATARWMGWGNKSPGAAFAGTAGSEGEAAAATEAQGSAGSEGQRLPLFCRTLPPDPRAAAPAAPPPRQFHHTRVSVAV